MKTLSYIKLAAAIIISVFSATSANAGEKVRVFELGETGITIGFPMTPEEIAAENASNGSLIVVRPERGDRSGNNVIVYEMGEGGHMIEFRATAEEKAAADAEDARQAAFQAKKSSIVPLPAGDRFEMAENGNYIVFPPAGVQTEMNDLVYALDRTTNDATGTQ